MVYDNLIKYLTEIQELTEKYNIPSEFVLALTILAISEVNNINYEIFKEYCINYDKSKLSFPLNLDKSVVQDRKNDTKNNDN